MIPIFGIFQDLLNKLRKLFARLQVNRFRTYIQASDGVDEGAIFSTFSLSYSLGVLVLAGVVSYLILKSELVVPSLLSRWVELFQIQEIFTIDIFSDRNIRKAYHIFVLIVLVVVNFRFFLHLVRVVFSVLILSPRCLVAVESRFIWSRIHYIPYTKILRLSTNETLAHKLLGLGSIQIFTGEQQVPLRLGPIPRFPAFIAQVTTLIQKT